MNAGRYPSLRTRFSVLGYYAECGARRYRLRCGLRLGLPVLNHFRVIFDHGQGIIIEP